METSDNDVSRVMCTLPPISVHAPFYETRTYVLTLCRQEKTD